MNDRIVVDNINITGSKVSASILVDKTYNVFYEFPKRTVISGRPGDAFLILMLPVAMSLGRTLEIKEDVTDSLLHQLDTYQDILKKWNADKEYKKIKILANAVRKPLSHSNQSIVATTFTGGVDSFYTLLKHNDEISRLYYIHGLDIYLDRIEFRKIVSKQLNYTAKNLGVSIIEPITNLRDLYDDYIEWQPVAYGPAIASTITLIAGDIKIFHIPGAEDYNFLKGEGTHLIINPLWNNNGTTFTYDGAEASRIEKVAAIVEDVNVQESLRVCWQNNEYNCGKCEKCIRTLTAIAIVGDVSKFQNVFAEKFNADRILSVEINSDAEKNMALDNYNTALLYNKEDIAKNLRTQIAKYDIKTLIAFIQKDMDILVDDKSFMSVIKKLIVYKIKPTKFKKRSS